MKYLALLSGGKDSCYNILHCHKNGHELVAAASLGPEQGKEELDSYLYQTVGQDAIELVARALQVPLYRQTISGSAIEQGSEYGTRTQLAAVEGDETEDLSALLSRVKSRHPDVQGVSVGAILSNYQRVRVEHVCRRLDLIPLCYLWQRDQGTLLSEMIDVGMEAIIIKVAGIGLTVDHLGSTLAEMENTLRKLNHLYGLHICGEGGEYETLTLDCPLFKHRIKLEEVETVIHSNNDFATVAFLRITKGSLVPKEQKNFHVAIPALLDDEHAKLFETFSSLPLLVFPNITSLADAVNIAPSITSRGSWVSAANIQRVHDPSGALLGMSIEEEVIWCLARMKGLLSRHHVQLCNCVIINIYVSSMEHFTRANGAYSTFFGTSPPARACVAVDLPEHINVRLDCLAFSERVPADRQALHVQGLSYWAPANIGPYSQAILAGEKVFISGQIGLVPSSLSLPRPPSLALETALACQHVERVFESISGISGSWEGHAQLIIYWFASVENADCVKEVLRNHIPSRDVFACSLLAVVKELPKGALVEKQVMMHTGRSQEIDEDDGVTSLKTSTPTITEGQISLQDSQLYWQKSQLQDTPDACVVVCMRGRDLSSICRLLRMAEPFSLMLEHRVSCRLFYATLLQASNMAQAIVNDLDWDAVSLVPCRQISTFGAKDWDVALCVVTGP